MINKPLLKALSILARSNEYKKYLRQELELMKAERKNVEPKNEYECVREIWEKIGRQNVIKKIIELIEGAEDKLDK